MKSLLQFASALAIMLPVLGAEAAAPATSPGPALSFRVERGSDPIGTHTVSFTRKGDDLHVAIDIELAVSFGPITLFRYEHRNRETWRDGRLVALETATNDDGTEYQVSAKATEKGLEVTSSANGTFIAPAEIIPTSYWNPATVSQTQLLDTQSRSAGFGESYVHASTCHVFTRCVVFWDSTLVFRRWQKKRDRILPRLSTAFLFTAPQSYDSRSA